MARTIVRLLLRHRNFALLWLGGLISLTGDWMLLTALPVYVYQRTGSTMATGGMLATVVTPRLLLGSVAGVFVDRWDRRRTLIVANLVLALGLLPLLLAESDETLWLVYAVAFGEAIVAQVVKPAEGALLPRLVEGDDLLAANSLNALNANLSRLIGPAVGGVIIGTIGLSSVALIDGSSFVVASLLTARIVVDARPPARAAPADAWPWASVWRDWLAGLRVAWHHRTLRLIFGFMAIAGVGEGVMGSLFAPFAVQVLGGGETGFGLLVSAQAIGGLIGSLGLAASPTIMPPARLIGLGALGLAAIDLMIFNYSRFIPGVVPGIVLMAIVGVPIAGMVVGLTTLNQQCTTDAYRGRVLGALGAITALASLAGALIGGALGDRLGIVTILNLQGVGYGLAGLTMLVLLPAASRRDRPDAENAQPVGARQAAEGAEPNRPA